MNVTVFGVGYVGLVQGAALAEVGHNVVCVDIDTDKITQLTQGKIPIYEPGLTQVVKDNYVLDRLDFTTDAKRGVEHADICFIAVGTPPDEDGSADLTYVLSVAKTIAEHMNHDLIVVNKSTVPVGTGDKVRAEIDACLHQRQKDFTFDVVSNPEFLKEGSALKDCMEPDRIIVGTDSKAAAAKMHALYQPFLQRADQFIHMDIRSAELTKYAANCMLATKISFMNEIANLAERLGADVESVKHGIGSDPRIGSKFINPGCGYGGSCFPKDVEALIRTAAEVDYQAEILEAVTSTNQRQKQVLFNKLSHQFKGNLEGKTIAVWGLAFKPNTDDMREAPSRTLMESLWQAGASVQAYDPEAMTECERIYGNRSDLTLMPDMMSALDGADALVICTEWPVFKTPDFDEVKNKLSAKLIIDGRNLFEPKTPESHGLTYRAIGRIHAT